MNPSPGPTLGQKALLALAPPAGAALLRGLTATWRVAEAGRTEESPDAAPARARVYAVWHECALAAGFYRGRPLHALASRSFDGELISRVLDRLGWLRTVRGSSSRGGSAGLKDLDACLKRGEHVLLTVDGPRGPRRVAKDGALQLARLGGHPVVPVAFACRPAWRLGSWDRMVVPPPFSRGVFWFGAALAPERGSRGPSLDALQRGLELASESAERFLARA